MMSLPFRCENFPEIATCKAASYVEVNEKDDDHEGFLFFLEPEKKDTFGVIRSIVIQNYGSAFVAVYGYTNQKQLDHLCSVFEQDQTAKRLKDETKQGALSVFGAIKNQEGSFLSISDEIRKSWTVLVPKTQLLLPHHYSSKNPQFWQRQKRFEMTRFTIEQQIKTPFLGLYVECRPVYDLETAIVGLGGVGLFG